MRGNKISIDEFAKELNGVLDEFAVATKEALKEAVDKTAKETAKQVRSNASSNFGGSGAYAKSWAVKTAGLREKTAYGKVVYSKPPYYRLAHLLEKGHAKVNGGRVEGRPHIAPAEQNAITMLVDELKSGIAKG